MQTLGWGRVRNGAAVAALIVGAIVCGPAARGGKPDKPDKPGDDGGLPAAADLACRDYARKAGWQVKLIDSLTGESGVLVSGGGGMGAAWSSDGSELTYTREGPGPDCGVWKIGRDGQGETQLVALQDLGWTPSTGLDWTRAPAPTGQPMILFDAAYPDFYRYVFAVNADGSGLTQLTFDDRWVIDPKWSPDGTRFVAYSEEDLDGAWYGLVVYTVDVVDGVLTVVADEQITGVPWSPLPQDPIAWWPDWSNSGEWIVVQCGGDLHVIAADDPTVVHALTQTPDVAELEPTFSATDDRIFFVVDGRKGGLFELAFDPITGTVPAGATPVEIDAGLADPRMPAARRDTH